MNTLTGDELLDLYIEAWTKLDAEIIIPHLASDFQYTSFWVAYSGAMSAIVKIQQAVCQSFPEYSRPLICRITYLCLGNNR